MTAEDVLGVFRDREDGSEPLTAPEVADRLGCSRRTALDRLHELAERGPVVKEKVGGRSPVWWIPDPSDDGAAGIVDDDPLFVGDPLGGERMAADETVDDVVHGDGE